MCLEHDGLQARAEVLLIVSEAFDPHGSVGLDKEVGNCLLPKVFFRVMDG